MAGLNPYRLYSFRELRAVMGQAWVVCRPCLRFVDLRVADDRDTRATTFSCCLCGREGQLAFEDPAGNGLQYDPRDQPQRHPHRILRLQQIARLAGPLSPRKVVREDLPQQASSPLEPMPRYRLKGMPFHTLGHVIDAGLVVTVYCPRCRRYARPKVPPSAVERCFATAVFRCQRVVQRWSAVPPEVCRTRGSLALEPVERIAPGSVITRVSLTCSRCGWQISDVREDRLPWRDHPIDSSTERYRCPGCGGVVVGQWHTRAAMRGPDRPPPGDGADVV